MKYFKYEGRLEKGKQITIDLPKVKPFNVFVDGFESIIRDENNFHFFLNPRKDSFITSKELSELPVKHPFEILELFKYYGNSEYLSFRVNGYVSTGGFPESKTIEDLEKIMIELERCYSKNSRLAR